MAAYLDNEVLAKFSTVRQKKRSGELDSWNILPNAYEDSPKHAV